MELGGGYALLPVHCPQNHRRKSVKVRDGEISPPQKAYASAASLKVELEGTEKHMQSRL